ncbi:MAG: IS21-like element helper ATPase IstB [Proteobacteria bacterium]|jgi:DNA replication protein DnaC|nr:AAA family ATPase [Desulfocapsa sp.]MBU3945258.1 IS21-like element helper ATPase IstB [Pseudomonadota bacterium]MCG2744876.1 IS21-like element helper ATPase IstB [Desulfobacteraceae bacterium]MBU3984031.1 IS21-like element helper ATPase IstB [Pseudomonadota bacterium]MBU4028847.1 IS21-like element helper ATPase IstB [Pseudomonadota bacterium]
MNKTATFVELRENLKSLMLSTMARGLEGHLRQAKEHGPGYDEFLLDLTVAEIMARTENRLSRRVREAKFPLVKTMEGFDFDLTPDLDIRLVRELSGCDYVKERRNIIFLGRSGTGKTHLATALGVEACKNNYRTRFVSCYTLVNELIEARQDKDLQRLIQRYSRYELLILDELGYIPFSREGSELLFQVLAERQEKGSVIITTNLGFADWTQVFGDPVMTAALLDRLTNKAHIVNCQWESYRLKQSLKGMGRQRNEGERA